MPLEHIYTGRFSVSHALACLHGLPPGSRYMAAVQGGAEYRGWTYERQLLTLHTNLMQMLLWSFCNQHAARGKQSKQPEMLKLPGQEKEEKRSKSSFWTDLLRQAGESSRADRNAALLGD